MPGLLLRAATPGGRECNEDTPLEGERFLLSLPRTIGKVEPVKVCSFQVATELARSASRMLGTAEVRRLNTWGDWLAVHDALAAERRRQLVREDLYPDEEDL